jgi:hypothetical protein
MARIVGVEAGEVTGAIAATFEAQAKKWGGPLLNHLVYARRPTIFRGAGDVGWYRWLGIDRRGVAGADQPAGGKHQSLRVVDRDTDSPSSGNGIDAVIS